MSFGPSGTTKTAENNLGGISNVALNQELPMVNAAGNGLLGLGGSNVATGTNFLNTLLNGNQANTAALLKPNIDQVRQGTQGTINAVNTLMPRAGGRSQALFGESFAPQQQIQNLFNGVRSSAATALPQIGLTQEGTGASLLGMGPQLLSAATGANSSLGNLGQLQQQISNGLWGNLGKGILGLATTPFGGGGSTNGLLGLL